MDDFPDCRYSYEHFIGLLEISFKRPSGYANHQQQHPIPNPAPEQRAW